jgi:hypothetical protein
VRAAGTGSRQPRGNPTGSIARRSIRNKKTHATRARPHEIFPASELNETEG